MLFLVKHERSDATNGDRHVFRREKTSVIDVRLEEDDLLSIVALLVVLPLSLLPDRGTDRFVAIIRLKGPLPGWRLTLSRSSRLRIDGNTP